MVIRLTAITGLPRSVVESARGRVDETLFVRELARRDGKIISSYDPAIAGDDPDPSVPRPDFADPFLGALKAPLTAAMTNLLRANGKAPTIPYIVSNELVFQNWRWSDGHGMPEAVTAMRKHAGARSRPARSRGAWIFGFADAVFRKHADPRRSFRISAGGSSSAITGAATCFTAATIPASQFGRDAEALFPGVFETAMTEIRFYHLLDQRLERVLPQLLEMSLARGWRVVVQATSEERIEALDAHLWTYRDDSFLPHGTVAQSGRGRSTDPAHRR